MASYYAKRTERCLVGIKCKNLLRLICMSVLIETGKHFCCLDERVGMLRWATPYRAAPHNQD
jgi:hypothetical protein